MTGRRAKLLRGALLGCALVNCASPPAPAPAPALAPRVSLPPEPQATTGVDRAAIDPQVSPCADLYRHACGGWLSEASVPSSRQWIELGGEEISKRRRGITHQLLVGSATAIRSSAVASRTAAPQRLFRACMDEAAIERAGVRPLAPLLKRIDQIHDPASLAATLAELHQSGVDALFRLGPGVEQATPEVWSWRLSAAASSRPARAQQRRSTPGAAEASADYEQLVAGTLMSLDDTGAEASAEALRGARASWTLEVILDRAVSSKASDRPAQVGQGAAPLGAGFDWPTYLYARGLSPELSPSTPPGGWLSEVAQALTSTPLPALRAYLKWRTAKSLSLALPRSVGGPISAAFPDPGETTPKPRRDQCVNIVERNLSGELSQAFAAAALSPQARHLAETLARSSVASLDQLFARSPQLTSAQQDASRARLRDIEFQLGAGRPEQPLKLPAGGDFAELLLAAHRARVERDIRRASAAPDRQLMPVPASTPNMFFHPALRAVIVPAGYLLPPNLDPDAVRSANGARAGFGFAHELAHGFNADWLSRFSGCVQADLSSTHRVSGLPAKSPDLPRYSAQAFARVEQETLADVVGIRVAYSAHVATESTATASAGTAQPPRDSSAAAAAEAAPTPGQLFWLNYAQSQCRKATLEGDAWLLQHDSHLPSHARVNYTARSVPEYARDFSCQAADPMAQASSCQW